MFKVFKPKYSAATIYCLLLFSFFFFSFFFFFGGEECALWDLERVDLFRVLIKRCCCCCSQPTCMDSCKFVDKYSDPPFYGMLKQVSVLSNCLNNVIEVLASFCFKQLP